MPGGLKRLLEKLKAKTKRKQNEEPDPPAGAVAAVAVYTAAAPAVTPVRFPSQHAAAVLPGSHTADQAAAASGLQSVAAAQGHEETPAATELLIVPAVTSASGTPRLHGPSAVARHSSPATNAIFEQAGSRSAPTGAATSYGLQAPPVATGPWDVIAADAAVDRVRAQHSDPRHSAVAQPSGERSQPSASGPTPSSTSSSGRTGAPAQGTGLSGTEPGPQAPHHAAGLRLAATSRPGGAPLVPATTAQGPTGAASTAGRPAGTGAEARGSPRAGVAKGNPMFDNELRRSMLSQYEAFYAEEEQEEGGSGQTAEGSTGASVGPAAAGLTRSNHSRPAAGESQHRAPPQARHHGHHGHPGHASSLAALNSAAAQQMNVAATAAAAAALAATRSAAAAASVAAARAEAGTGSSPRGRAAVAASGPGALNFARDSAGRDRVNLPLPVAGASVTGAAADGHMSGPRHAGGVAVVDSIDDIRAIFGVAGDGADSDSNDEEDAGIGSGAAGRSFGAAEGAEDEDVYASGLVRHKSSIVVGHHPGRRSISSLTARGSSGATAGSGAHGSDTLAGLQGATGVVGVVHGGHSHSAAASAAGCLDARSPAGSSMTGLISGSGAATTQQATMHRRALRLAVASRWRAALQDAGRQASVPSTPLAASPAGGATPTGARSRRVSSSSGNNASASQPGTPSFAGGSATAALLNLADAAAALIGAGRSVSGASQPVVAALRAEAAAYNSSTSGSAYGLGQLASTTTGRLSRASSGRVLSIRYSNVAGALTAGAMQQGTGAMVGAGGAAAAPSLLCTADGATASAAIAITSSAYGRSQSGRSQAPPIYACPGLRYRPSSVADQARMAVTSGGALVAATAGHDGSAGAAVLAGPGTGTAASNPMLLMAQPASQRRSASSLLAGGGSAAPTAPSTGVTTATGVPLLSICRMPSSRTLTAAAGSASGYTGTALATGMSQSTAISSSSAAGVLNLATFGAVAAGGLSAGSTPLPPPLYPGSQRRRSSTSGSAHGGTAPFTGPYGVPVLPPISASAAIISGGRIRRYSAHSVDAAPMPPADTGEQLPEDTEVTASSPGREAREGAVRDDKHVRFVGAADLSSPAAAVGAVEGLLLLRASPPKPLRPILTAPLRAPPPSESAAAAVAAAAAYVVPADLVAQEQRDLGLGTSDVAATDVFQSCCPSPSASTSPTLVTGSSVNALSSAAGSPEEPCAVQPGVSLHDTSPFATLGSPPAEACVEHVPAPPTSAGQARPVVAEDSQLTRVEAALVEQPASGYQPSAIPSAHTRAEGLAPAVKPLLEAACAFAVAAAAAAACLQQPLTPRRLGSSQAQHVASGGSGAAAAGGASAPVQPAVFVALAAVSLLTTAASWLAPPKGAASPAEGLTGSVHRVASAALSTAMLMPALFAATPLLGQASLAGVLLLSFLAITALGSAMLVTLRHRMSSATETEAANRRVALPALLAAPADVSGKTKGRASFERLARLSQDLGRQQELLHARVGGTAAGTYAAAPTPTAALQWLARQQAVLSQVRTG